MVSDPQHIDDIEEIITSVPAWIIRWGNLVFLFTLLFILSLSLFIKQPDVVRTTLVLQSENFPKTINAKSYGKIIRIVAANNSNVKSGQDLAYIESTGNHIDILNLLQRFKNLKMLLDSNGSIPNLSFYENSKVNIGELQPYYQILFQDYLKYRATILDGRHLRKKDLLGEDLSNLNNEVKQFKKEKNIQERALELATQDYEMHKKLEEKKVESVSEFRDQELKYLSQKARLIQTETSLIRAQSYCLSKQKEIAELEGQIVDEKESFGQSVNSFISKIENWKSLYVLTAPQDGQLIYAKGIQERQTVNLNQELFYLNPGHHKFHGQMYIAQSDVSKVLQGQLVIIKVHSFPFEEYGKLKGKIVSVSELAYRDSAFLTGVDLISYQTDNKKVLSLKPGMKADAEIITNKKTLFEKMVNSITKSVN